MTVGAETLVTLFFMAMTLRLLRRRAAAGLPTPPRGSSVQLPRLRGGESAWRAANCLFRVASSRITSNRADMLARIGRWLVPVKALVTKQERMCLHKSVFFTADSAEKRAAKFAKSRIWMRVYKCPECSFWHLTRKANKGSRERVAVVGAQKHALRFIASLPDDVTVVLGYGCQAPSRSNVAWVHPRGGYGPPTKEEVSASDLALVLASDRVVAFLHGGRKNPDRRRAVAAVQCAVMWRKPIEFHGGRL